MEIFELLKIIEDDITEIIVSAGGAQIPTRDKEEKNTADYSLDESIIELKLIEEEGLEKETRINKIEDLFEENQKGKPSVIIDKRLLCEAEINKYHRILEGPIKTAIKKASKQLKNTENDIYPGKIKVCMVINTGYASLFMEDFEKIVTKVAKNDSNSIDFLIVAGAYFYGDSFDFYSFFPFELIKIKSDNNLEFTSFNNLRDKWGSFTDKIMTEMIIPDETDRERKKIIYDFEFERSGKYYIQPTPLIGKKSDYFINGRPRKNTSGINTCPLVGKTFPCLSQNNWIMAKKSMVDSFHLEESQDEYLNKIKSITPEIKMPIVPIDIDYLLFKNYCISNDISESFNELCLYANKKFQEQLESIHESLINLDENKIIPVKYILLQVQEIGQDKKFDISSIYEIKTEILTGDEKRAVIFENERMFFEYASILAASYAIKLGFDTVCYSINKDFGGTNESKCNNRMQLTIFLSQILKSLRSVQNLRQPYGTKLQLMRALYGKSCDKLM